MDVNMDRKVDVICCEAIDRCMLMLKLMYNCIYIKERLASNWKFNKTTNTKYIKNHHNIIKL